MRNGLRRWGWWLCVLFCAASRAWGVQATLVGDAHVSALQPTVNSGSLSNLNVGGGYTALVQFNFDVLPAGTSVAQITRATLRVYLNRADTAGTVSVQSIVGAWNENSVTYATMPPLGAVVQTAQASTMGQFVTFDVTALVQAWVSGASENNGMALSSSTAVLQFDSKENDQTAHAPQLEIALEAAGAGGSAGAAGATGATGATGVPGATGLIGPQGTQGVAGAVGATGATGANGITGATGPAGSASATGATGPAGATGATGATGTGGFVYQGVYSSTTNYALGDVVLWAGSSYVSLVASNRGQTPSLSPQYWGVLTAQGPMGSMGAMGATGVAGPTGALGSAGPAGQQGMTGPQGIAGQAGAQGIPGLTGATGLQGPMGPTGAAGAVGLSFQGTYNSAVNYSVGNGVLWQGAGYVSLIDNNHGNTPDQNPAAWSMFAATGMLGATGAMGATGTAGTNGSAGVTGATGPAGITGATGTTGSPGLVYQGTYDPTTGYALGDVVVFGGTSYASLVASNRGQTPGLNPTYWGVLTSVGQAGATGAVGPTGSVGATGLQGLVGSAGPQGVAGPTGIQGPAGAQGLTGSAGAQGAQGPMGAQGIAGQGGAQGVPGITGPTGPQGPAGAMGSAGTAGAAGVTGSTGPAGSAGLVWQGSWASATNYELNDVVSYAGTSYVSITASNSDQRPDLSPAYWAVVSMGSVGATGSTGPTGPIGSIGPAGVTGATGVQGVAGPVGPTGIQGPAGAQGLTGSAGAQGAQGATGSQGTPGQAGAQGIQGVMGATGAQGPAGVIGANGPTGVTGATGPSGAVGMNFRGPWSTGINYSVNDAVTYGGSTYLAQSAGANFEPDIYPSYWTVIAQAGVTGTAGAIGAAGTAASVSIGTVSTLAAGSQATVTNSGTSQAAVLNFGIPQGAQGASGSSGGSGTSSGNFAGIYHAVNYTTPYYSVNLPNASANETGATSTTGVLAWVPSGCTASQLSVYSQQSSTITVTLRVGTPGSMSNSALAVTVSTNSSATGSGSVTIAAGQFIDYEIGSASGTLAGVWTALTCQ